MCNADTAAIQVSRGTLYSLVMASRNWNRYIPSGFVFLYALAAFLNAFIASLFSLPCWRHAASRSNAWPASFHLFSTLKALAAWSSASGSAPLCSSSHTLGSNPSCDGQSYPPEGQAAIAALRPGSSLGSPLNTGCSKQY